MTKEPIYQKKKKKKKKKNNCEPLLGGNVLTNQTNKNLLSRY